MRKWISNFTIVLSVLYLLSITTAAIPALSTIQQCHIDNFFSKNQNLWNVMSPRFSFSRKYTNNYYVRKQIRWFQHQQYYLTQLTYNSKPYIYYVLQQTEKRGMPAEIALLPMIESNYNPFLYSKCGATGLWQLMPNTATSVGLLIAPWYDGRRDVVASTNAALHYLQYLQGFFHNWLLAIAAYDAGEGTISMAIRYNRRHEQPTDFWSLPLPYETREYVPKLLALADVIKHHIHYGLHLTPVENRPFFTTVTLIKQMNLKTLVKLSNSTPKLICSLNPGLYHSSTILDNNYNFLVPIDKADYLQKNLAALEIQSSSSLGKKIHHRVRAGESLSVLASRYHTSITEICQMNKLKSDVIQIGKNLLISEAENIPYTIDPNGSHIAKDSTLEQKHIIHTMKPHETISHITHLYHVTAQQIYFFQNINKIKILVKQRGKVLSTIAPPLYHYKINVSKLCYLHYLSRNNM